MEKTGDPLRPVPLTNPSLDSTQEKVDPTRQKVSQEGLVTLHLPSSSAQKEVEKESVLATNNPSKIGTSHVEKIQEAVSGYFFEDLDSDDEIEALLEQASNIVLDRSKLQQVSFATVTRYLSSCEELVHTHRHSREIGQLCEDLKHANWSEIVQRYKGEHADDLARDGLKAFHDGQITMEQFTTLTYCWAMFKKFPGSQIHIQPLFQADGRIDPQAKQMVEQSLYKKEKFSNFFSPDEAEKISRTVFKNMSQRPDQSEKFFFYVEVEPLEPERDPRKQHIREALEDLTGLTIDQVSLERSTLQMIPTFSMMQAYVDGYGKENTIALCPTIGASTRADLLRNAEERGRDVLIPFPGVPTPQTADGFLVADPLEFLLHDFYHCLICSQVPDLLRKETASIANSVASLQVQHAQDQDPFVLPFLETLYGRMVDMDFGKFRPRWKEQLHLRLNAEKTFLLELQDQIVKATLDRMELKLHNLPSQEQRAGLSPAVTASLEKWDKIKEKLNENFSANPDFFYSPLREDYVNFCNNTPLIKELADKIYQSGFLSRFHISEYDLQDMESFYEQIGNRPSDNALLSHHFLRIHQKEKASDI